VNLVASTGSAEFFKFQLARGGLFVFCGAVVCALALGALQMNYVAHGATPLQIIIR
jgi:hypothetical protein